MTEKTLNHGHVVTGEKDWLSYLCEAAPEVLWFHLCSRGDYQGEVFAVGKYLGKCLVFSDYYGSCSGCGAWGEGGEPTDLSEVLKSSKLFDKPDDALEEWRRTGMDDEGIEAIGAILGETA
jgi:hypothetical protein